MTSAREHFKIKNTLVCLLKAIEGKTTQVELRNENVIVGTILCCDGFMNLTLQNVTFKPVRGKEVQFTDFYVQGKQIRYVHIPDEVDMLKAMEQHVKQRYEPPRGRGGARGSRGGSRGRGSRGDSRGGRGGSRGGRGGRGRGRDDGSAQDSLKRGGFAFGQGSRGRSSRGGSRR